METKVACVECGSTSVDAVPHVEDVFQCRDCETFFEDDGFELEYLRKNIERHQVKDMMEQ